MTKSLLRWVRKVGASCFFLGYFPFAPGTVGALITVVTLFLAKDQLAFMLGPENALNFWWTMIALIAVSFFLTDKGKEVFGRDDPPQTIFDEVAGQFVTFFMVPINIKTLLLGFVLFRFYDIVKPFPVYNLEEIEGGVGVTMDDVGAGVLANITLMILLGTYHWIQGYF
ncbi:MAG: phosphatidylglycerophosphatase A [Chitinispirillales bacterium]|nr:phosphatidylglycerophosphatase A [Chitinispirillales bacterium]